MEGGGEEGGEEGAGVADALDAAHAAHADAVPAAPLRLPAPLADPLSVAALKRGSSALGANVVTMKGAVTLGAASGAGSGCVSGAMLGGGISGRARAPARSIVGKWHFTARGSAHAMPFRFDLAGDDAGPHSLAAAPDAAELALPEASALPRDGAYRGHFILKTRKSVTLRVEEVCYLHFVEVREGDNYPPPPPFRFFSTGLRTVVRMRAPSQ
jgi:hypothetical protein